MCWDVDCGGFLYICGFDGDGKFWCVFKVVVLLG